jgi:hypothetical protein
MRRTMGVGMRGIEGERRGMGVCEVEAMLNE